MARPPIPPLMHLEGALSDLATRDLLRDMDDGRARADAVDAARTQGVPFIDASANDYLGLAADTVSRETLFRDPARLGAGASRLVHGTHAAHIELERALADWVAQPTALLFSSGYAANVGLLSAVSEPGSVVVSDRLNHASIVDGCRLGRGAVKLVPHLDLAAIREELARAEGATSRWVVVESYYSMDGDTPDLERLAALCKQHQAGLIVDEAHALGVFGKHGAGLCRERGVTPTAIVGPLGKGFGASGAFVAGPSVLRRWLWNRARSFVFSTAPAPLSAALTLERLRLVQGADELRARLAENCRRLREALEGVKVPVLRGSHGPIVPVLAGSPTRALHVAELIRSRGILVQAIRPPSVPEGGSRIRLTVSAGLGEAELQRLGDVIRQAWAETERFT